MLVHLAISGWIAAIFLVLALFSCRRNKEEWRDLYAQTKKSLDALRHEKVSSEIDRQSLDWYRKENERLTQKCEAICHQVRRMKGRGRATLEVHPRHIF